LKVVVKDVHNKFYAAVGFVDFKTTENREEQHGQVVVHILGVVSNGGNGIADLVVLFLTDGDSENSTVNVFIFSQGEPVQVLRHKPRQQQGVVLETSESKHLCKLWVKGNGGVVVLNLPQFPDDATESRRCL
jgi:hypothetical protein